MEDFDTEINDFDKDELFPGLANLLSQVGDDVFSISADSGCTSPQFSNYFSDSNSDEIESDADESDDNKQAKRSAETKPDSSAPPPKFRKTSKNVVLVLKDEDGNMQRHVGPNRNAIMAKLNRERKKKRMDILEKSVQCLSKENAVLRGESQRAKQRIQQLEGEVEYLKGVIANQSVLADLLDKIPTSSYVLNSSLPLPMKSDDDNCRKALKPSQNLKLKPTLPKKRQINKPVHFLNDKKVKIKIPPCKEKIVTRPERKFPPYCSMSERDHSYATSNIPGPETKTVTESPQKEAVGVCLHVSNSQVSLEFCANCNMRARSVRPRENALEDA